MTTPNPKSSEVKAMSEEELSLEVARLVGFDKYVIVKRGLYYRENAGGYTNSLAEAWKLPLAEAKKYEMYADRDDVPFCEKVRVIPAPTPDYPRDLNAMHEAEKTLCLPNEEGFERQAAYGRYLSEHCQQSTVPTPLVFAHAHATARQRAEAFVLTLTESNAQRGEE